MPEGDTLYRIAATLRKALLSRVLTRFESSLPEVSEIDSRMPVSGRTIEAVEARGKHLLIVMRRPDALSDPAAHEPIPTRDPINLDLLRTDLVLHTHLRMTGSWHIYRPGETWQKPQSYAKAVIHTDAFVAICFSAPVVELMTARETIRHPQLIKLGPDAIAEEFDPLEARRRLRQFPDVPVGVAIMKQNAMAGVGNVYKSEVLFILRINPFTAINTLSDEMLDSLIAESRKLLTLNRGRGERQTHFSLDRSARLWAYGRSGEPCRVCGARMKMRRQGLEGRSTYYCPACQGVGEF